MSGTTIEERTERTAEADPGLAGVKPLPAWFFAFEAAAGAAYDLCKAWDRAWMVLVAIGAAHLLVALTVLRRRAKLVKAMLKNSRTRKIAFGLVALRMSVHVVLGALGAQITSAAGHLAFGLVMAGATVCLLWYDQRVTFRALGLSPARDA
ncbi:hypothetical protein ACZ90_42775 [Streptomyces albus subsp. albus]|nr:hypothetical protein ACZ90_42775 [Streptomyces albus subsp. albus]